MDNTSVSHYHNFVDAFQAEMHRADLPVDDLCLDTIDNLIRSIFPGLSNEWWTNSLRARLPPRGERNFSSQGSLSERYCAPIHTEVKGHDPRLTVGINVLRGLGFEDHEFYLAFPGLDAGKGVIMSNEEGSLHIWDSLTFHGTVVGRSTRPALLANLKKEGKYASFGIGSYQKQLVIKSGAKIFSQWPTTWQMEADVDRQHREGALGWFPFSDESPLREIRQRPAD